MPDFARRDPLGRTNAQLVRYADEDPMRIIAQYPVENDTGLPTDMSSGCAAVQAKLRKLVVAKRGGE